MTDVQTHDLQGSGSLRKCFTCGRWFHNEADAGAENEECDGTIRGPHMSQETREPTVNGPEDLGDWHFIMGICGYFTLGPNELTAMVAEGYDWFRYSGVPEHWDRTADDLATMRLLDKGKQQATPYWWALPGVTDYILKHGRVA